MSKLKFENKAFITKKLIIQRTTVVNASVKLG